MVTIYTLAGINNPLLPIRAALERATDAAKRAERVRVASGCQQLPALVLPELKEVRGATMIAGPCGMLLGETYGLRGMADNGSWTCGAIDQYCLQGTAPAELLELLQAAEQAADALEHLAEAREYAARSAEAIALEQAAPQLAELRRRVDAEQQRRELDKLRARVAELESAAGADDDE